MPSGAHGERLIISAMSSSGILIGKAECELSVLVKTPITEMALTFLQEDLVMTDKMKSLMHEER